jgi:thiamine biosynthesis lipoprotein
MGTAYSVEVVDLSRRIPAEDLRAEMDAVLGSINVRMSTYLDDSELSRFNVGGSPSWIAVSPELATVMSDGACAVTVDPLVNLWDFAPTGNKDRVPTENAIRAAMQGGAVTTALMVPGTGNGLPTVRSGRARLYFLFRTAQGLMDNATPAFVHYLSSHGGSS